MGLATEEEEGACDDDDDEDAEEGEGDDAGAFTESSLVTTVSSAISVLRRLPPLRFLDRRLPPS